ncbi:UDP-glucose 4-epimerase, partial [Candidatus Hakubella thermalkaliphila]
MCLKAVAVTGGSSFIGKHLIKRLVSEGFDVCILVHEREFKWPGIKSIKGDLITGLGLDELIAGREAVIHVAGCFVQPRHEIFKINVTGTFNLLEKCAEYEIERVVFSSGVALCGEPPGRAWQEDDIPRPNTVYGLSKFLAEKII